MDSHYELLARGLELTARATNTTSSDSKDSRPPIFKFIGISLAVGSGLFIGTSFVLKKHGLLKANEKYNEEAGEGYGYLKNVWWWTGMTLMIVGEICNFVAYAFVDAILVTPLGALSVVVTTILSAIFLKERLSFVGKVGCFNCIVGSVVIVMNAPQQSSVATIQDMKHFVIAPGFLSYAGVIIVGSAFIALWAGPRYGKKTMLVYLSVCSLIGGLSVVATQGLGAAIVTQIGGTPQFNQWFLYVLLVFVIATLLTEIIYLNKALNLFNAALVTPTYYVFFTSATIVTSAILFQGFKGTVVTIVTVVLGFLQICSGVILLQMSKSAKDVPDAAVFKGDLDQVREIAEQEQPESEPKADAIRGTAAIVRRISQARLRMEHDEARRLHEEKEKDRLEPVGENEIVEWDGLRRRKTIIGDGPTTANARRRSIHPPLGMSHFPDEEDTASAGSRDTMAFFENMRSRAQTAIGSIRSQRSGDGSHPSPMHPVALTEIAVPKSKTGEDTPIEPYGPGSLEDAEERIYGLPPGLKKQEALAYKGPNPNFDGPPSARRQFSFQNMFGRGNKTPDPDIAYHGARPVSAKRQTSEQKRAMKNATEEERLGLVKGDSNTQQFQQSPQYSLTRDRSESESTSSSHDPPLARRHYDGDESGSDTEWQMTSPPQSNQSPARGTAQSSPSLHTATAVPITTARRNQQSPTRLITGPPPAYQATSNLPSTNTSRTRDRSRSEVEYDERRARFEGRARNQGEGNGDGAFI